MRVSFLAVALGLAAAGCRLPCATHADCGAGRFCETPTGECGSETGHCTEIHSDIGCYPATTEELAVCGCDGVTYESDCFRREAVVSKASEEPCE